MDNYELLDQVLAENTERPFIIAEVGQAHEGSLGQAISFIEAIAETGANAVKFQTHFAEEESSKYDDFRVKVFPQDKTRSAYWKRMEFNLDEWKLLADTARDKGLVFLSSPFSIKAVDILEQCGVVAWKIASGEIYNYPMLDKILETNKPLLISTGMSSWKEIDDLYNYTRDKRRVFFQCTTEYPSKPENIGLNNIEKFKLKYTDTVVGLSDHSGEIYPSVSAFMLGARVFELHVTWSKQMFGPDTSASLTLEELTKLVSYLNLQEKLISSPVNKDEMRSEKSELVKLFGRGIYAKRDIEIGKILSESDLCYLKPALGISASAYKNVIGKTTISSIFAGEPIHEKDLK